MTNSPDNVTLAPIGLSADEVDRRRRFMTATNSYTIMGLNPWAKPIDVYHEKVHGATMKASEAAEWGNRLEPLVLAMAADRLGPLVPGDWHVHEDGLLAATTDASTADGEPVEGKTSGIVGPGNPREWGQEGTDEIPDRYIIQTQHQMFVTRAKRAWVPAIIGGRGFVMYMVKRNEQIIDAIRRADEQFWEHHVAARVPPEGTPSLETLRRIIREPGKAVPIDEAIVVSYANANARKLDAVKQAEDAQAALINALGDAERGIYPGGTLTYHEQTRKGYTVAESTYRVLRIKQLKKETE